MENEASGPSLYPWSAPLPFAQETRVREGFGVLFHASAGKGKLQGREEGIESSLVSLFLAANTDRTE